MFKLVMIAAGGAGGAVARYLFAGAAQRLHAGLFPVGTLAVNVVGCLLIGVLGAVFAGPQLVREEYRTALMIGFLGGFTTFSTYGWETLTLGETGGLRLAALNVVLSNGLGLLAVWFGYRLTIRWMGA
ncbi:MAG: fluoride efflux transporter CrcB [Phycisphaerae bacterium]